MIAFAAIVGGLLICWMLARMLGIFGDDLSRWVKAWLFLTAAAFFSGHFALFVIAVAAACVVLARKMPGRIPSTYAAVLPALPTFAFTVPGFAGINYIVSINYVHIVVMALLLPAFWASRKLRRGSSTIRNVVDLCFIGYALWLVLLAFVHVVTITESLRSSLMLLLALLVPYLAISRLVQNREQIRDLITAVVFTGLAQTGICLMEVLLGRTPYFDIVWRLDMDPLAGLAYVPQFRWGMPRARGSLDGGLGLLGVAAISALFCLAQMRNIPRWRVWFGAALLAVPIVLTGSRGAMLMLAMVVAIRISFRIIATPGRFLVAVLGSMFAIPYALELLSGTEDEFGTFEYRAQLLETFFPVVFERPFFGWGGLLQLYATQRFNHLIQGEGIIDMVNTFLGTALENGIPGFLLFAGIFLCSVMAALRRLQVASPSVAAQDRPIVIWICSVIPSLAFLLLTTSLTGHSWYYLSLLAATASALLSLPLGDEAKVSTLARPQAQTGNRRESVPCV